MPMQWLPMRRLQPITIVATPNRHSALTSNPAVGRARLDRQTATRTHYTAACGRCQKSVIHHARGSLNEQSTAGSWLNRISGFPIALHSLALCFAVPQSNPVDNLDFGAGISALTHGLPPVTTGALVVSVGTADTCRAVRSNTIKSIAAGASWKSVRSVFLQTRAKAPGRQCA